MFWGIANKRPGEAKNIFAFFPDVIRSFAHLVCHVGVQAGSRLIKHYDRRQSHHLYPDA